MPQSRQAVVQDKPAGFRHMERVGGQRFARGAVFLAILLVVGAAIYLRYVGLEVRQVLSPIDMRPFGDAGYETKMPSGVLRYFLFFPADGSQRNVRSQAVFLEDGRILGPAHSNHFNIGSYGRGSYSHWGGSILFSAAENSDPRTNGRIYTLVSPAFLRAFWFWPAIAGGILFLGVAGLAAPVRRWWGQPEAGARQRAPAVFARSLLLSAVAAACALLLVALPGVARGAIFWVLFGAAFVLLLLATREMAIAGVLFFGRGRSFFGLQNTALTVAAIFICLAGFELYLAFAEVSAVKLIKAADPPRGEAPAKGRSAELRENGDLRIRTGAAEIILPASLVSAMRDRRSLVTMPMAWKEEKVTVPGAMVAYRWQGVVHVLDQNSYRRLNGPFPPKDPRKFRIMVVGDSLTYGSGIEMRWTYSAQLERLLAKDYRVEVINLGRNGDQSEDVLQSILRTAPDLDPDLIIYGVCLNDFLPSGVTQYNYSYSVPIPDWLINIALERTRFAHLLEDAYQALLLRLHVREDFFDDILENFKDYQNRFAADINRMNAFARARGLPPLVGIVLDQYPSYGGKGYHIAMMADAYMKKAGFDLIPAADYYKSYNGRMMVVSHWEGHPDEEANAIFATRIANHLYGRADLEKYRK